MDRRHNDRKRSHRTALILATALLLPLMGSAAASAEHRRHGHGKQHYDKHSKHEHRHHGRHEYRRHDRHGGHRHYAPRRSRHRNFRVPRDIRAHHYERYSPYFHGNVFYGPHGHHHRVYYFPVLIDGHYGYRPHAYCGGGYYQDHYAGGSVHYAGPRFGFHIDF